MRLNHKNQFIIFLCNFSTKSIYKCNEIYRIPLLKETLIIYYTSLMRKRRSTFLFNQFKYTTAILPKMQSYLSKNPLTSSFTITCNVRISLETCSRRTGFPNSNVGPVLFDLHFLRYRLGSSLAFEHVHVV